MSAPALNVAPVTPPVPGGSTAAKPAGGAPGAFESVLAETAGQTQDATTGAGPAPKTDLAARLPLTGVEDEILSEGERKLDRSDIIILAPPAQADASLALAAAATATPSLAATPALAAPTAVEATPQPAFGRDKAKGSPAAPALAHANAHAGLAEKVAGEPGQPLETEVPADVEPQVQVPAHTKAAAPHASAQAVARAAPPSAVAQAAATDVQAPVAEIAAEAVVPATAEAASADAAVAAAISGRVAAPAAASRPAEPAKAERSRAAVEDAAPAKPAGAARKTTDAKPAAGTETAPAVETAAAEVSAGRELLDDPDAVGSRAEAPTAGSTAAATGPAPHIVRGSPETVANLAAAIVKKLDARETRFDLELDPHGLGKVDVRIHIGAQGQLTAAMVCDNPQAAAELKARAAELQRQLEQAGFNLSGGITFDVAGDRGHARQGWAENQDQSGSGHRGRAFQAALDTAGEADLASSGPLRMRRGVTAGLDMRI